MANNKKSVFTTDNVLHVIWKAKYSSSNKLLSLIFFRLSFRSTFPKHLHIYNYLTKKATVLKIRKVQLKKKNHQSIYENVTILKLSGCLSQLLERDENFKPPKYPSIHSYRTLWNHEKMSQKSRKITETDIRQTCSQYILGEKTTNIDDHISQNMYVQLSTNGGGGD